MDKIYLDTGADEHITEDIVQDDFEINLDQEPKRENGGSRVEHCGKPYSDDDPLPPGRIGDPPNPVRLNISGTLRCQNQPWADAEVQLMEGDNSKSKCLGSFAEMFNFF